MSDSSNENSYTIFNPYKDIQQSAQELSSSTLLTLDDRYVNVGENVFNEDVSNLNVQNLNITSIGKIYFTNDSTEQTTAYDPIYVEDQINDLKLANSKWTGKNDYTNLNVVDSNVSNTTNASTITQSGTNLVIKSTGSALSGIQFKTNSGSTTATVQIDQFGNFSGINDMNCNKLKANEIRIPDGTLLIKNDSNNLMLMNNIVGKSIQLMTSDTLNTLNFLEYDSKANLTGINNMSSSSVSTSLVKLGSSNSQISQGGTDLLINNNASGGTIKFNLIKSDGTTGAQVAINQFGNLSGLNDVNCNRSYVGSSVFYKKTPTELVIDNKGNNGAIYMNNYTETGILNTMTIDKNINVSGINDLYVQRLFFNGSEFDYSAMNALKINCQMIRYSTPPLQTRIVNPSNSKGITFCPDTQTDGTYNPMALATDHVLVGTSTLPNTSALALSCWSDTKTGFRIKPTETEAYNLKILDGGLKFSDNSVQTTAMTSDYLTSFIQNVVNQMSVASAVPTGTVLTYAGPMNSNFFSSATPPAGYLFCYGQAVSQSTYANLYSVIGNTYLGTKPIVAGQFYLPDYRNIFFKGIGWDNTTTDVDIIQYTGVRQKSNVGSHKHNVTDQGGVTEKNMAKGGSTTVAGNGSANHFTDAVIYDPAGNALSSSENRPHCIGVSYIIKY